MSTVGCCVELRCDAGPRARLIVGSLFRIEAALSACGRDLRPNLSAACRHARGRSRGCNRKQSRHQVLPLAYHSQRPAHALPSDVAWPAIIGQVAAWLRSLLTRIALCVRALQNYFEAKGIPKHRDERQMGHYFDFGAWQEEQNARKRSGQQVVGVKKKRMQ